MNLISNLLLKSISFGACLALASCSEIKKESESPEIEANKTRVLIHAKDFINSEGLDGFDVDDSSSVRLEG